MFSLENSETLSYLEEDYFQNTAFFFSSLFFFFRQAQEKSSLPENIGLKKKIKKKKKGFCNFHSVDSHHFTL